MDRKRRELLRFLGIASGIVLMPFPDMDWECVIGALKKHSQLDTTVIQDFEAINNRYWHLYVAAASKSLVLDGVLGQFKMLVHFLKEPHTAHMHQHLCTLSSDLSQLAGEIFFDRHEHKMANTCYAFAMSTAKEAKAIDLWASALVRSSFLLHRTYSKVITSAPLLFLAPPQMPRSEVTSLVLLQVPRPFSVWS